MPTQPDVEEYGWTAVPRSLQTLLDRRPQKVTSKPVKVEDIQLPKTSLSQAIQHYAQKNLPAETYNHSMRVYYFGQAITTQHFPHFHCSPETLLLAALLHDIGTTTSNMESTHLSFEFAGGITALDLLKTHGAPKSQGEAVCETIIRHQDLGDSGNISTLTAIIHFGTVLDNAGLHAELVARETMEDVVRAFPRRGWTSCFASVVRRECELKPWANTTRIEGFAEMVEQNTVMAPFDSSNYETEGRR